MSIVHDYSDIKKKMQEKEMPWWAKAHKEDAEQKSAIEAQERVNEILKDWAKALGGGSYSSEEPDETSGIGFYRGTVDSYYWARKSEPIKYIILKFETLTDKK
jgi:hypothetical protein